jgi:spermidine/putrescine ABC transporter ATP-binding subunit
MPKSPVIEVRNLTLKYGTFTAIDNIDLTFHEGEFFALLGPSGCGKSSLLRTLAGFNQPTSGELRLDGKDLVRTPARKRPINMMFQSYALFPHMTVRQNIAYGLEVARRPKDEVRKLVDNILEKTHLMPFAARRPNQLSGGQRQRVALARALVMEPRVVLLDEPLGALDKKLREAMQLELKRLQHEMGLTFVIVTHDQEEALVLADRIAIMNAGKVEQVGTPQDLYERPVTRFVADFIGEINMFEGFAKGTEVTIPELGTLKSSTAVNGAVSYAVRPERLHVSEAQPQEPWDNVVEGQVVEIAYHGRDASLIAGLCRGEMTVTARLTATQAASGSLKPGCPAWISWNATDARVLPA